MTNPVDELLKEAGPLVNLMPPQPTVQDRELEMWKKWDKGGRRPDDLRPLLQSLKPLIRSAMGTYLGRVRFIPDEAIEAEFNNQAVQAIKSYNPNRGAKLSTWIQGNIRKGGRFVKTYQNVGRIVEKRQESIGAFNAAKTQLTEELGREADDKELLVRLKEIKPTYRWTIPEIKRLHTELRADILSSQFESDPTPWMPNIDKEVSMYLEEELTPDEAKVWKSIHKGSLQQARTGQIAKQYGWSDAKVSRLRKSIEQKAQRAVHVMQ